MFDADETSVIAAAATTGDPYAWVRVMATLAECDASELDGGALFAAIDGSRLREAPAEANALRALDAAGAVVRAQYAFSQKDAEKFERRFSSARDLLATRAAQAGVEIPDPAAGTRFQRLISTAVPRRGNGVSGCAPFFVVFAVLMAMGGGVCTSVSVFLGNDVADRITELTVPGGAHIPVPKRFGMNIDRIGVATPIVWRAIVGPGHSCRYAVGRPGESEPVDRGVILDPTPAQSVVVHLGTDDYLYADGCSWVPAMPPTPGAQPYEGDYVVGVDVPAGVATVSAGDGLCRVHARRYNGSRPTEIAAANLVSGRSTTIDLRGEPSSLVVLNVRSCNVRVG